MESSLRLQEQGILGIAKHGHHLVVGSVKLGIDPIGAGVVHEVDSHFFVGQSQECGSVFFFRAVGAAGIVFRGRRVEIVGRRIGAPLDFCVVADAVLIRIRYTISATNPQGVLVLTGRINGGRRAVIARQGVGASHLACRELQDESGDFLQVAIGVVIGQGRFERHQAGGHQLSNEHPTIGIRERHRRIARNHKPRSAELGIALQGAASFKRGGSQAHGLDTSPIQFRPDGDP